jgi:fatty acid desaturase
VEELQAVIQVMVQIMQIPFTIWGFTLSFWDIMLALIIGGVVIYLIGRFLE